MLFLSLSVSVLSAQNAGKKTEETIPPQNSKFAVFDFEIMVQAMPEYKNVDSLLQMYQSDSLATEHDFYVSEFQRLDSIYKVDSLAGKPKNILDIISNQRAQFYVTLSYWQQIAQNKLENKRAQLAQPLFERIAKAYQKVLEHRKYDLILKPASVEFGSKVDNLFVVVADELHIPLPEQLGGTANNSSDDATNAQDKKEDSKKHEEHSKK